MIGGALTLGAVVVVGGVKELGTVALAPWRPTALTIALASLWFGVSTVTHGLAAARRFRALREGGAAFERPALDPPYAATPAHVLLAVAILATLATAKVSPLLACVLAAVTAIVVGASVLYFVDAARADWRWSRVRLRPADAAGRVGPEDEPRPTWSPPPPGVIDAALCGLGREAEEWTYVQLVLIREERPELPDRTDDSWFHDADLATTIVIVRTTEAGRLRIRAPEEPFGPFEPPHARTVGQSRVVVAGRERRVRVVLRARFDQDVVQFAWPPRRTG
jgi:hypothetical protein